MASTAEKSTTRARREKGLNFRVGIQRLAVQMFADAGMRAEALEELNNIALHIGKKITHTAKIYASASKTIKAQAIMAGIKGAIPKDLAGDALALASKAVANFKAFKTKTARTTGAQKALLQLSPPRAEKLIREYSGCSRVSGSAGVALAAAIESILVDILTFAEKKAQAAKKKRISVRYIREAVTDDRELLSLLGKGIFSSAGVHVVDMKKGADLSSRRSRIDWAVGDIEKRRRSRSRSKSPKASTRRSRIEAAVADIKRRRSRSKSPKRPAYARNYQVSPEY